MGSCFSFLSSFSSKKADELTKDTTMSVMQPLVRSAKFVGKRPTLFSAYARAANRYGFQTTKFAPFQKNENLVVHINAKGESGDVPAASVQNGAYDAV